jgi:hypothetical protein
MTTNMGYGVYAKSDISPHTIICSYLGVICLLSSIPFAKDKKK